MLGAAAFTQSIVLSIEATALGLLALNLGAWRTSVLGFTFVISSVAINPSLFPSLPVETVASVSAVGIAVLAVNLFVNYRRTVLDRGEMKSA